MDPSTFGTIGGDDPRLQIATHLTEFLRDNVREGQEAEVAVNPELGAVLVFIDGELALSCSFDDLLGAPGGSPN